MQTVAILDVDGTLVDTNYHHTLAWGRAFEAAGLTVPLWRIHRHIGMGADQLVESIAGGEFEESSGEEVRDAEARLYGELIDEVRPLEGAAMRRAEALSAVMVGDTVWDVEAARRADVKALAVLTGGFSEAELRDAGAADVFESAVVLRERLDSTPLC